MSRLRQGSGGIRRGKAVFDLVDFLERVGQDATLAHATSDELMSGTLAAGLSPGARALLADRTSPDPSDRLRAPALCCMQFPAEEEEEAPEQDEPETDELPRDGD